MHGLCEAKDGTQVDELLQAGESGHKRTRQDAKNESRFLKMAGSLPRRQETGRLKGQKEGKLPGRNTEDCQVSLRWEDSWHRIAYPISPHSKMLQDRGVLPKEEGVVVREGHARRVSKAVG